MKYFAKKKNDFGKAQQIKNITGKVHEISNDR